LKIATQFGSGLTNILYIMDEPSKGLHPKDYQFLLKAIVDLKVFNNTVIMVEHKKRFLQIADYHLEMGPRAGKYGGEIVGREWINHDDSLALGPVNEYNTIDSKIPKFLMKLTIKGARTNNLKNLDLSIPLGKFVSVIGVSGSGKSSLVVNTIYEALLKYKGRKVDHYGEYDEVIGCEQVKEVHLVDQKAIGKNNRSNPATYTGAFDLIRAFFAKTIDAKQKKFTKEHFSFNSSKGQCPECKGLGKIQIPMHYMEDIYVTCNKCQGKRYQESVLKIKTDGSSIFDVLDMEISEAAEFFKKEKKIYQILHMIERVGLGYIKLGQSATTLSGGEAQRIKLAKELSLGNNTDSIYILDEPTSGLHDDDIKCLIQVLQELKDGGATVIVIEHNPQLINESDWIIEMGPSGGELGGKVINEGWLDKSNEI
jgi:excinuclease ABC A subunit